MMIQISLKFVPRGPISNRSALVQKGFCPLSTNGHFLSMEPLLWTAHSKNNPN